MRALVLPLLLLTTGCTLVGTGAPVVQQEYDLVGDAVVTPVGSATAVDGGTPCLQVEPFGAAPLLDPDGLVWRRGPVEVGSYSDHRWARRPQDGAREALAGALATGQRGVVVATDPPCQAPRWVLTAHLARCEEVCRAERWLGVLELWVSLARGDGAPLLRGTYAAEEPATARNPPGVIEALQRAAARVAREAARDVGAVLAAELAPSR